MMNNKFSATVIESTGLCKIISEEAGSTWARKTTELCIKVINNSCYSVCVCKCVCVSMCDSLVVQNVIAGCGGKGVWSRLCFGDLATLKII